MELRISMSVSFLFVFVSGFLTRVQAQCDDIDSEACLQMLRHNPLMCVDPSLSTNMCPKFCGKCPLTCFYSNGYVSSTSQVTAKKTCNIGELCMLIQSTSVKDGVQQILMSCASEDVCGGTTYAVFGKRSLTHRNLNLQCCSVDNCNTPEGRTEQVTQTSTISTTLPSTISTQLPTTHTTTLKPASVGDKDRCDDGHSSTCQTQNGDCRRGTWHCIDKHCHCVITGK